MKKIQIVESEELLQYADFDRCEVWLLNRMRTTELDARVINEPELTESPLPSSMKLPQLLSMMWERHPNEDVKDGDGNDAKQKERLKQISEILQKNIELLLK